MRFMYQLLALLCLYTVHVCSAGNCICTTHNERSIYTCDDTNNMAFSTLYHDGLESNCLVEVNGLHSKKGWMAGLYVNKEVNYQRIVYIQEDAGVVRMQCTKSRLTGHVESEPKCYPNDAMHLNSVNGGWTTWNTWSACTSTCGSGVTSRARSCTNPAPKYYGTKCTGPASETKACNTNLCPINGGWTTWTTWSACPVTCGSGTITRTRSCTNPLPKNNGAQCPGQASDTHSCNTNPCPVSTTLVPVPTVIPSTRCDSTVITDHLVFKTSATHPAAKTCTQSNTNSDSMALLLEACQSASPQYRRWTADLKVVDHCSGIRQGDPLGVFINGRISLGIYAAFWRCKTTSFEIVYQPCGSPAKVIDVKNIQFTPETFYTLKW